MPSAAILLIGSELTAGRVSDRNGSLLARELERSCVRVRSLLTVGDSKAEICKGLSTLAAQDPDLIVISGGLGPTFDDLTAQAIADYTARPLTLNRKARVWISKAAAPYEGHTDREIFEAAIQKQALLPRGAILLKPVGTAVGFVLQSRKTVMVILPGVPREARVMWQDAKKVPSLKRLFSTRAGHITLRFYGAGEPEVSAFISRRLRSFGLSRRPDISVCGAYGEVEVVLSYRKGPMATSALLVAHALEKRFRQELYSKDGSPLEVVIANLLERIKATYAVAESCTGGLLGAMVTAIPGASKTFYGGVISYDNTLKTAVLGVSQEDLDNRGAVSKEVAAQMAQGCRLRCKTTYALAITGIAGPESEGNKPVGLVFIGLSGPRGTHVERYVFSGGREEIRRYSVASALHLLYRELRKA